MSRRDVAITGMGCAFPGAKDLTEFWYNLVNGIDPLALSSPLDSDTPASSHLPGSNQVHDNTEQLLRDAIEAALRDAGMATDHHGLPHQTKLILAQCHWLGGTAKEKGRDGLAADLTRALGLAGDASHANHCYFQALELGVEALREGACDVVVLAAILSARNDWKNVGCGRTNTGNGRAPRGFTPTSFECAAALVLKRRGDVETAGESSYAFIKGLAVTQDGDFHLAYEDAGLAPDDIGFLEILGGDWLPDNTSEFDILKTLFGPRDKRRALRPLGAIAPHMSRSEDEIGLTSLIKAALCLSNKVIPPTLNGETLQPMLHQLPFYLNIEARPWIQDTSLTPRRAAVSALHPDGSASHVVLEEIIDWRRPNKVAPRSIKTELAWESELVVLCGKDTRELAGHVARLMAFLQRDGVTFTLADVAYTQSLKFNPRAKCRLAIVCRSVTELQEHLRLCHRRLQVTSPTFDDVETVYFSANGNHRSGKIACIFPGQGFPGLLGPYADHLLELCLRFPEIREAFDLADQRDGHPEDPAPTNQVFFPPATFPEEERRRSRQRLASPRLVDVERIQIPSQRDLSSYGVLIANWGSWKLLENLGLAADMMFGQSHGELSALCSAGALDFDKVISAHWEVDLEPEEHISQGGRMALAYASESHLAPILERYRDVHIAVHVSPSFQILGGEAHELEAFIAEVRKSGIWTQFLPYPAIHTPRLTSLRPIMEPVLETLPVHPFRVPVYSGMVCDVYPNDPDAVRQTMIANLDHPVLLWQTTRKMYQDGARIFVQVGGGATMYTHAKTNIGADDVVAVSLDVDYRGAIPQLNHMCAALLTHGVNLNLSHLYQYRSVKALTIEVTEAELGALESVSVEAGERFLESETSPDEPRMPFIGLVRHYDAENREIVIERILDLSEDLFLADHVFIFAENIKPINARSPVLPITVSMEVMAEVAACLAPGCGLLGFEDVKATRWIELVDSDTLCLNVSAKSQRYDEDTGAHHIAVAIYIEEQDAAAIQANVLFGQRYEVSLDLDFSELKNPRPYPLTAKQIYQERVLFHGPMFQSISGDTVLGERGVVGEVEVLPKDVMFASTRRPELLTDPIILDAVGQLIGLWAIDQGVYVFPIAIGQVEFYCPTPAVGTQVPVHVQITRYSSKLLYADVEIQDGSGRVWTRIKGWGDWVFRWSKKVYEFRRQPTRHCVSDDLILSSLFDEGVAQTVTETDLRDSDLPAMARFYLHMKEMPTFWELGKVPARQLQWLLGRIAAKDAVRQWLARLTGTEMMHPAGFVIENDEKGQPVVKKIPEGLAVPKLGIAHSEDRAVAIARKDAVGIDIEKIADRDERFFETFTTRQERALLADFGGSEYDTWITRLWCAKEAAGKLIGTGMEPSPVRFETTHINGSGVISILHHPSGRSITVKSKQENDFIIAYTAET